MIRRAVRDFRNEHPVDKRKENGRSEWEEKIFRLLQCPEKSVHDVDPRHLIRDVAKILK